MTLTDLVLMVVVGSAIGAALGKGAGIFALIME